MKSPRERAQVALDRAEARRSRAIVVASSRRARVPRAAAPRGGELAALVESSLELSLLLDQTLCSSAHSFNVLMLRAHVSLREKDLLGLYPESGGQKNSSAHAHINAVVLDRRQVRVADAS